MTRRGDTGEPDDDGYVPPLNEEERQQVREAKAPPSLVVHEIVRQQGVDELERPIASLLWAGFAAGVSIWLSLIVQGVLTQELAEFPGKKVIVAAGYSAGFLVVILGRLQLFTESTITAVLPLVTNWSVKNLGRTLRLWTAVLAANLAGTLIVAFFMSHVGLVKPELLGAMIEVSRHATEVTGHKAFLYGIPAGFILATIAWLLPSVKGQEVLTVALLTWIVSLGGFSHVVAGSAEMWLLVTTGEAGAVSGITNYILPVLAGNILGGTGLFAVLAHAQVRSEL